MMTRLDSGKVSDALGHVERELAALWAPAEGEPPRSRVCTGNLVVLAGHAGRDRAVALVDAIVAADAARTFLVDVDPKMPLWGVETSVTARCRRDGDQLLCAERIDLSLGAGAAVRGPSLLASLAVAEVPTTVLVLAPPPPALLGPLLREATRLVLDSDSLGLEATRALAGATSAQIVDLAWLRLLPWRNQLAAAFDPPALRPAVSAVRSLHIVTASPGGATSALAPATRLLVGWLASRLSWKLRSPREATDPLLHPVALELSSRPAPGVDPGALLSVELTAQLGDAPMHVELTRDLATPTLQINRTVEGHPALTERISLDTPSLSSLVDRALSGQQPDAVLRQALATALPSPSSSPEQPS